MAKYFVTIVIGYLTIIAEALVVPNATFHLEKSCTLPHYPEHGHWTLENGEGKPNDIIAENGVIKFECALGYKMTVTDVQWVCGENWGLSEMPECEELCQPLDFPTGTKYRCFNKAGHTVDCSEAVNEVRLQYVCPDGYQTPGETSLVRTCINGTWGIPQPECVKQVNNTKIPILEEVNKEGLEQPWNAILYTNSENSSEQKFEYTCGGSILSHRIVLTNAGCVKDYVIHPGALLIAAGKMYNKYDDPRDLHAQYSQVTQVIMHPTYTGIKGRYLGDIALLLTKMPLIFNTFVQPISFVGVDAIQLLPGDKALITKYGENGKQEDIKIFYKDNETCKRELNKSFAEKYLINDKICAGYKQRVGAVGRLDSGKGLAVKNPGDGHYYLYAMTSAIPFKRRNGHRIFYRNALYTNLTLYHDFINNVLSEYE